MPHDKNGTEINVGDEVVLRGKVTNIYPGATACNVSIASATSTHTLTASDLEKVSSDASVADPAAEAPAAEAQGAGAGDAA